MKISELSQAANVPVPTIKFYIREGLLPAGALTARNQAEYSEGHVERLALIRAMREAAGLPIETIARVLRASEAAKEDSLVAAIDALERPVQVDIEVSSEEQGAAKQAMLGLAKRRGWQLSAQDQSLCDAARALSVINTSFKPHDEQRALDAYAEAIERIAMYELPDNWAPDSNSNAALRYAVLGTVLLEPFILALRRMAHVARTRKIQRRKSEATPPKRRGKR